MNNLINKQQINQQAVNKLLKILPNKIHTFNGSEYPLPIKTTFLGKKEISIKNLRNELLQKKNNDVKDLLEPVLLAAELVEAASDDKEQFFLTDRIVQTYVFRGSKWRAGWVLILGGKDQNELIEKLKERRFMVFTDLPNVPDTIYIGNRPTSPIYFLQMMVRYGLVWGQISPGDDHKMGHFLEEDIPGFIIIYEDLPPLKYLVTLGLMKMGAPAVVPSSFPFPYGRRETADKISDIIEKGSRFPNLRQKYYKDEIIHLPDFCKREFVTKNIKVEKIFGSTSCSLFCLRPAEKARKQFIVIGKPDKDISILIDIEADNFTDDISLAVEKEALKAINYLSGVCAYNENDIFHLELGINTELNPKHISEAIYWGIRLKYPRLEKIAVQIIFDNKNLKELSENIKKYKTRRQEFIENMTEENTDEFCACTECRPFSLVHTCILYPDRMPMCNSRTYYSVKAAAYFGTSSIPWKRPSEKKLPLQNIFKKGKLLDPDWGEYEGCNRIYKETTNGQLERVYLHSLRNYPITSCGCFQALAFWLDEVQGIGIMSRDSSATTPDGKTWAMLANKAGGKQSPGIAGISLNYIRSPNFLKGDGGIGNIVWVDSDLYGKIYDVFLPKQKVATEKNVKSIEELKKFLNS